jgi:hypothetical protein
VLAKEKDGAPGEIRTPDPLVRSQMLYPAELRAHWLELSQFTALGLLFATSIAAGRVEGGEHRRGSQRVTAGDLFYFFLRRSDLAGAERLSLDGGIGVKTDSLS